MDTTWGGRSCDSPRGTRFVPMVLRCRVLYNVPESHAWLECDPVGVLEIGCGARPLVPYYGRDIMDQFDGTFVHGLHRRSAFSKLVRFKCIADLADMNLRKSRTSSASPRY